MKRDFTQRQEDAMRSMQPESRTMRETLKLLALWLLAITAFACAGALFAWAF